MPTWHHHHIQAKGDPPPPPSPCLHLSLDYFGVDLGHTVDGVGADDAEMGHIDPLGASLLYQGHPPQPVHVVREEGRDVLPVETRRGEQCWSFGLLQRGGNSDVPNAFHASQSSGLYSSDGADPSKGCPSPAHMSLDRRAPQIPTEGLVGKYTANGTFCLGKSPVLPDQEAKPPSPLYPQPHPSPG